MNMPNKLVSCEVTGYTRFQALWRRCLLANVDDNGATIHRLLVDAYCEPQRHYHTMAHIEHCLIQLDTVKSHVKFPDALELSIWFHDVVYQPGAPDNEQRSADLFMAKTQGILTGSLRQSVQQHIMATLHCGAAVDDLDSQFMVDIDLSSFGLPWTLFKHDSENVRREMQCLSDNEFYPKQARFQCNLLAQPRFYQTDYYYSRLEKQARQNLADYFTWMQEKTGTDFSC